MFSAYLQYHSIEGSTEDTLKHKRKEIGPFLRHLEEQGHSMLPGDVTLFDVMSHLEAMKLRGLAAASIHTRRRALHAWFAWMVDWEMLSTNPVTKVKSPRLPRIRKPFLSESDFNKLLDLCPLTTLLGSRRASVLWLLATTGMRRRELLMLKQEDLNWERGEIRIVHGKGQKERNVPFSREAQRPMLRYLNNRWDSNPCLWVTEEGRPLSYVGLGTDVKRLFERAEDTGERPDAYFQAHLCGSRGATGHPKAIYPGNRRICRPFSPASFLSGRAQHPHPFQTLI